MQAVFSNGAIAVMFMLILGLLLAGILAIAWVLRRPEVPSAIVGTRSPRQIETTAPAADWTLSQSDIAAIETLLAEHREALARLGNIERGRV